MKLLIDIILTFRNFLCLTVAAILFFWHVFWEGKNSIKNKENEEAANSVKKFNRIKKDVNRLSDNELDSELQKWKGVEDKS